jgi:hypothetical protein
MLEWLAWCWMRDGEYGFDIVATEKALGGVVVTVMRQNLSGEHAEYRQGAKGLTETTTTSAFWTRHQTVAHAVRNEVGLGRL